MLDFGTDGKTKKEEEKEKHPQKQQQQGWEDSVGKAERKAATCQFPV